jgi:hypothetical protein
VGVIQWVDCKAKFAAFALRVFMNCYGDHFFILDFWDWIQDNNAYLTISFGGFYDP